MFFIRWRFFVGCWAEWFPGWQCPALPKGSQIRNYSGAFLKNQNYEFKKFKRFNKLQAVSVQILNF